MTKGTQKRIINEAPVYSPDDYKSNDGMLTMVWGPSMWHVLHTMSFNYPVCPTADQRRHYKEFVLSLENVLPCGKCRKNLTKNFKKHPLTDAAMESRETFSRYVYDLHEVINTMLHKKSGLTYEDVKERYEHFRARCALPKKLSHRVTRKKGKGRSGEKGCTEPLYGEKSKCVLQIVPHDEKCETFQMDERCIKTRGSSV